MIGTACSQQQMSRVPSRIQQHRTSRPGTPLCHPSHSCGLYAPAYRDMCACVLQASPVCVWQGVHIINRVLASPSAFMHVCVCVCVYVSPTQILRRLLVFGHVSDHKSLQPVQEVSVCAPAMLQVGDSTDLQHTRIHRYTHKEPILACGKERTSCACMQLLCAGITTVNQSQGVVLACA